MNEVREFGGEASGAVSSFAIDRETGALRFLSQVASGGGNPCHLSMSHCGRFLMVANHEAGSVAVFPVAEDGNYRTESISTSTNRKITVGRTPTSSRRIQMERSSCPPIQERTA